MSFGRLKPTLKWLNNVTVKVQSFVCCMDGSAPPKFAFSSHSLIPSGLVPKGPCVSLSKRSVEKNQSCVQDRAGENQFGNLAENSHHEIGDDQVLTTAQTPATFSLTFSNDEVQTRVYPSFPRTASISRYTCFCRS